MSIKDSIYNAIDDYKAAIDNSKTNAEQLAIDGDIVIVVDPAAVNRVATTAAWSRTVKVKLQSTQRWPSSRQQFVSRESRTIVFCCCCSRNGFLGNSLCTCCCSNWGKSPQ